MAELFNDGGDPANNPTDTNNQNAPVTPQIAIPAELQDMVGEGKKYGTVEAALASIVPAQQHIANLESENAKYKDAADVNSKLDTVLQQLNQPNEPQVPTSTQQLNVGDIVNAVKNDLKQEATVAQKAENRASVEATMTEKFGDAAPQKSVEIAQSLGMSVEDLTSLVESSPTAALKLMGLDSSPNNSTRTQTDVLDGKPPVGEKTAPKTVMFGAKSKDIINAWRECAPE